MNSTIRETPYSGGKERRFVVRDYVKHGSDDCDVVILKCIREIGWCRVWDTDFVTYADNVSGSDVIDVDSANLHIGVARGKIEKKKDFTERIQEVGGHDYGNTSFIVLSPATVDKSGSP